MVYHLLVERVILIFFDGFQYSCRRGLSIHRIEGINRITDKQKYPTMTVKESGIEQEFKIDTGSPMQLITIDNMVKKLPKNPKFLNV